MTSLSNTSKGHKFQSLMHYPDCRLSQGQLPQLSIDQVTDTLPASPAKLQQIRDLTTSDPTLSQLRDTIYKGWLELRKECPSMLYDYWNFREELTIEDGLILKGERIVIPPTLRPEILDILHKGHLGQEKCLLRALYHCVLAGCYKPWMLQTL